MYTMDKAFTTNLYGHHTRIEERGGREFLVAPVVMLTEGVHNGSNGPLYYPEAELRKTAAAWDGKPIVVYHPTDPHGRGQSAYTPGVWERQGVGTVKKATWDKGKLRAEAWLDVKKLTAIAPELVDPLLNDGGIVEVSTGLYTDNEDAPGWYGGKNFKFVARNHRPDHLALLPTGAGACSVADGCGLFQTNEENTEMTTYYNPALRGAPLFGHCGATPTMNYRGGLPLPSTGPDRVDEPVYNHGDGEHLLLPVMNFDAPPRGGDDDDRLPCRCQGRLRDRVHNYRGDNAPLPLPTMTF